MENDENELLKKRTKWIVNKQLMKNKNKAENAHL